MSKLFKDLSDHKGNPSSMRFNNRYLTIIIGVVLLCVGAYVIINAVNKEAIDNSSFTGMGIFVGSLGGFLFGSYKNQVNQKKHELDHE